MSFDLATQTAAIRASKLSKCYQLYHHPKDRLKQFLWPHKWLGARQYYRELWALRDIDLIVKPGEVVGIVGQNGSGKSTLLQLVCGTLTPTYGEVQITGRIAEMADRFPEIHRHQFSFGRYCSPLIPFSDYFL
mgnify:CR=1 FL=1